MILAWIDYLLDRITMYRVILYYLIAILLTAVGLSSVGLLPYAPLGILGSTALVLVVSLLTNLVFARVFEAPSNIESPYITALILACILPPIRSHHDLPLLLWASVLAMASKYILAIRNKHIFNPAAIAGVLTTLWLNESATWWVGTAAMLPVVILGGLLMIRKMRRYDLVLSFLTASIATVGSFTILSGHDVITALSTLALRSPLFFFAFVMLTEPLTSPPTNLLQAIFGGLVGFLFAPQVHLGNLYLTPELALVFGNLFAYLVSPKIKERLLLVKTTPLTPEILEFEFQPARPFVFHPGQYMEFTLPHTHADSRGNRRYFTLASSPTEARVKLGVKFYPNGSSFKRNLHELQPRQTLMTGQLAGDFTLPKDPQQKLAFIAGGIGVTPFRSMIKYLTDAKETRNVTLLFMNKGPADIVYQDIFNEMTGLKVVHTFTDTMPPGWTGRTGRINDTMIQEEIPDYRERTFYISGPHAMVAAVEASLQRLKVQPSQIKKDFFPGLT